MSEQVSTEAISTQIQLLGDQWADAELRGDVGAVEQLLAEDFQFTGTSGNLISRSEWLSRIPHLKVKKMDRAGIEVRVFNETAVLTGLIELDSESPGKTVKGLFRYGDIFSLRGGRWQVVYSHFTPVRSIDPKES
jgi:ketosteroid isomerase-like protein